MEHLSDSADIAFEIDLLCRAAHLILENGGETYRVEETARRMAKGFGLSPVSIAAFPTSIFVGVGERVRIVRVNRRGTNTFKLERTNDVSRRVERGEMSAQEADAALRQIAEAPGASQATLCVACGLAAASFSLPFGGGLGVFAVTFLLGMLVQAVQPLFSKMEMGVLFGNFTGGLLTAMLAQAIAALVPYGSVNAAIGGGIMPLLSGLLMTTAMRDTMYGDLISGITRVVEALLLAASVALGVYTGLKLVALLGGVIV